MVLPMRLEPGVSRRVHSSAGPPQDRRRPDTVPKRGLVHDPVAVQRDGHALTRAEKPDSLLGEKSVVMGRPATADIVACEPSSILAIGIAATTLLDSPGLLPSERNDLPEDRPGRPVSPCQEGVTATSLLLRWAGTGLI